MMVEEEPGLVYGVSHWSEEKGQSIRTSGCIVLFCEEGMAIVSVEFKPRVIRKGDLILIFPDTMFVVNDVSRLFSIKYIEIPSGLFDEVTFVLSSQFLDLIYDDPIFPLSPGQRSLLEAWERQFVWIMQCRAQKPVHTMLRNHIENLLIGLESVVISESRTRIRPISTTRMLFNNFCRLVGCNCHLQHSVRFYAEQLHITPYYLSKITAKTVNMSPKELIDRQIIVEMKRLLTTTDISIKELALRFHFDTVSYMARFFRRYTGQTPDEFRNP